MAINPLTGDDYTTNELNSYYTVDTGNGPEALNDAIDSFVEQNISPENLFDFQSMKSAVAIATDAITPLGNDGEWEAIHYANDLNAHHGKFKFLFKVKFLGFPGSKDFYYYVSRCDKPKIRFVHQEVNYYNFRSKVLTNVTYEPLSISFLDEIGNSVFKFVTAYIKQRSGQGSGNYGINEGFGTASSSKPYTYGYTQDHGQQIVIEQVFANGTLANRFYFANPRIESIDFDELSHEDNNGSVVSLSFSYDAINFETVETSSIYSWGQTDLLLGGGTSGAENAGDTNGVQSPNRTSARGDGINGSTDASKTDFYDALQSGSDSLNQVPSNLRGLITPPPIAGGSLQLGNGGFIGSGDTTLSANIQGTLKAITTGQNMKFGGSTNFRA